jgi:hypothetical protein
MYREYGLCQIRSKIKYARQDLMQTSIGNFIMIRSIVLKAKHADEYTNFHITCSFYSLCTNNAYKDNLKTKDMFSYSLVQAVLDILVAGD